MAADSRVKPSDESRLFIGIDVGTASVRAGLFTEHGNLLAHDEKKIKIWENPSISQGSYEQSSEDVWSAVCTVVKTIIKGVDPSRVCGIGFDATCSLVAVDVNGYPVTVSPTGDPRRNVILWKDHRAVKEADYINGMKHPVLKFVGGCISPEMQPPKLLWLKRNLPQESWSRIGHFFDLCDYLVYKSSGVPARSLCSLVCKWTYIGHHPKDDVPSLSYGWNDSFWKEIGLGEFVDEKYERIGSIVMSPGQSVGLGLSPEPASQMGLKEGTQVAVSLIDAHAGGLGMLGADLSSISTLKQHPTPVTNRLAVIAGTSCCHMATSSDPVLVPGVWGPYCSAMIPNYFLNEGGQSAAGSLIDHILKLNQAVYKQLEDLAESRSTSIYTELNRTLSDIAQRRSITDINFLTADVHILPDFHGNRSPLADPTLKGMITGLSLNNSLEEVSVLYLATIQALAYGTKHIIEVMVDSGHHLEVILVCGSVGTNSLYLQTHSDVTGLPVLRPKEKESVLLGSAILARAAYDNGKVEEVMRIMAGVVDTPAHNPSADSSVIRFHERKYAVFKAMLSDQLKYRRLMNEDSNH